LDTYNARSFTAGGAEKGGGGEGAQQAQRELQNVVAKGEEVGIMHVLAEPGKPGAIQDPSGLELFNKEIRQFVWALADR
jgi:hypothetical protein